MSGPSGGSVTDLTAYNRRDDAAKAVLAELQEHERLLAGRDCGCVKCRILTALDGAPPRREIALRAPSPVVPMDMRRQ